MNAALEFLDIVFDLGSSSTCMDFDAGVLANAFHDFENLIGKLSCVNKNERLGLVRCCVNLLKNSNSKSSGLSSPRLSLSNRVSALNDWKDTDFLDLRRFFEPISVNTSKDLFFKS